MINTQIVRVQFWLNVRGCDLQQYIDFHHDMTKKTESGIMLRYSADPTCGKVFRFMVRNVYFAPRFNTIVSKTQSFGRDAPSRKKREKALTPSIVSKKQSFWVGRARPAREKREKRERLRRQLQIAIIAPL
jgi:hypothetical protein